jgi:hypothetical protein
MSLRGTGQFIYHRIARKFCLIASIFNRGWYGALNSHVPPIMRGTYSLGSGFGSSAIIGDRQVMASSGRLLNVRFWPVAALRRLSSEQRDDTEYFDGQLAEAVTCADRYRPIADDHSSQNLMD